MEFNNAIFAGGGSRCLWQLGFWEGANSAGLNLSKTVNYAASTSAGSAMATAALLNRAPEALDLFKELATANPSNIHWHNLKPGGGSLLPHMNMYRSALKQFLTPADLAQLQDKQLEFLMAKFPGLLPSSLGTLVAFTVYGLEKHLTGVLHPSWTQKMGFVPLVSGNKEAQTINDLIDTILASSSVPPVLPTKHYQGHRVLDGGIIDNVPAHLADGRPGLTLVLLSKRYKRPLPEPTQRVYIQPSEPIRLDKFDYADPIGLQDVYDLGLCDGNMFANSFLQTGAATAIR